MKMLRKKNNEFVSTRLALAIGASIGLGVLVHEGFLLVAGAIAVGALAVTAVHPLHQHTENARPVHQNR
jgi:hypothetical protein